MSIWFEGPVAQAVGTANSRQCLLLVCLLQDGDDTSAQYEARFTQEPLAAELATLDLVALKVMKESQDGLLFGQIYPIMSVPAVYLIRNGLLADFLPAQIEPAPMLERIQRAVQGHFAIPPPPGTPLPATGTPESVSTSSPAVVEASSSPSTSHHAQHQLPGSSTPQATTTTTTTATTTTSVEQESVKEKLKKLQEERRVQREKEEREAAKQRELQRRANSKALQEAQTELKDKEAKKLKDKLEREKREEAEYRKKLKQQLEEDKQRRRAEREKERERLEAAKRQAQHHTGGGEGGEGGSSDGALKARVEPRSSPLSALSSTMSGRERRMEQVREKNEGGQQQVLTPSEVREQNSGLWNARNDASSSLACESTRLNVRLFDGSSIRNVFQAADTLSVVRQWIDQNRGEDDTPYNIVQVIPPRMFTDEEKTLRDLDLCPSATLVLKPIVRSTSAYGGSGDGAVASLMGLGWSALSLAGKAASAAYNTVSYYNPLREPEAPSTPSSPSAYQGGSNASSSARAKKDDDERRTTYNGNSTSLE